jgi:hypothetical protein
VSRRDLRPHDHEMHELRNRALRRIIESMLLVQVSRTHAADAHRLAVRGRRQTWERMRADQARRWPRGAQAPLRLVKG